MKVSQRYLALINFLHARDVRRSTFSRSGPETGPSGPESGSESGSGPESGHGPGSRPESVIFKDGCDYVKEGLASI